MNTIVVLGATGQQGSSVVEAFLQNNNWKVRGLTRNVESETAKKLAAKVRKENPVIRILGYY